MMFSLLKLLRSVLRTLPSVCVRACVSAYVCAYLCHHLCVCACMSVCISACMYVAALLFWFVCSVVFVYMIIQYSSTTTVLYIKNHGDLVFLFKKFTQKPSSQLHPGTLAVLVRYNQAQKCHQYDPKSFQ